MEISANTQLYGLGTHFTMSPNLHEQSLAMNAPSRGLSGESTIAPAVAQDHFPAASAISNNNRLEIGNAEIPLLDLQEIAKAEGNERIKLIREFGDGLKNVGFIAIKAPDSITNLLPKVNDEMRRYFNQSQETKMRDCHGNNGQTGFSPKGTEGAAGTDVPDNKETYFIPPNFTTWPNGLSNFETVMKDYHEQLAVIADQLMGYVHEYLEEPIKEGSVNKEGVTNLVRLAHYFAPKPNDNPKAIWAGEHEDLNALTLLPRSKIPGLQLQSKDGEWLSVNVPEGYIIVNTGEQLERKTAGLIQATTHRVVNPGGEYARSERFASIFFASWATDYSLKPFESCLNEMTKDMTEEEKDAFVKQFPDVSVDENLISRLIEMGAIPDPSLELVKSLHEKGLIKKPSESLLARFPFLAAN